MKKKLIISLSFLALFVIYTLCVLFVDKQLYTLPDSDQSFYLGFYTVNMYFHNLTGVHFELYKFTDIFEIAAIVMGMAFGVVGLVQWIKRKHILKVDYELSLLGILYMITLTTFAIFVFLPINYRPVLIDGKMESSYPSSTTFLALVFMLSAFIPIKKYTKNKVIRWIFYVLDIIYMIVLIFGRIDSGVHWFTDVTGAIIIGIGLVFLYFYFVDYVALKVKHAKEKQQEFK